MVVPFQRDSPHSTTQMETEADLLQEEDARPDEATVDGALTQYWKQCHAVCAPLAPKSRGITNALVRPR